MLRIFFGLLAALLFSDAAHAAFPATPGACQSNCSEYEAAGQNGNWMRDPVAACAPTLANYPTLVWDRFAPPNVCVLKDPNNGGELGIVINRRDAGADPPTCPAGATLSGSTCTCGDGYAELGATCVATSSTCPVGQGKTTNRTEGWARSANPDANDVVSDLGSPSTVYGYNDGVCVGNITGVDRCWRSQEPSAQGLYRLSCDYTMVVTATSTSTGESNSDPDEPVASCPGFVGEVNGKTVCVGTSSNPLPAGTDAPNAPTSAGNPSAGPKPSTGPGSGSGAGRTPSTGNGGNNGGPSSAAVGRGGSGQRGDLPEVPGEICGAAPLPPCNVKVDETGVPAEGTAESRFGQGVIDLDAVKTEANTAFNDHRDIQLPNWTWTCAFPSGCTALVLPAFNDFEIDVCQFQPIIHDLMSVLWVIAGIWGLIALFQRATGT